MIDFDDRSKGKKWYDKIKADPTRYAIYREKENERHRRYQQKVKDSYRREKEQNIPESVIRRFPISPKIQTHLIDGDNTHDTILNYILSQMYRIKWEDSELRDVWEIMTRLKKLGASL